MDPLRRVDDMRAADGDFEAFFRANIGSVIALAAMITGRREVAAEIAQEAMLRAYRHWPRVSRLDLPIAWVRRVATNLAIDQTRRDGREHRTLRRMPAADHVDAVPTSDWHDVLAGLPPRQRAVIALHYGADLSVEDVGAALDISAGTVKSTLARARTNLMESWKGESHAD